MKQPIFLGEETSLLDITKISDYCKSIEVNAGDAIASAGEVPEQAYYVESGIIAGKQPQEQTFSIFAGRGALLFGENINLNELISMDFSALVDSKLIAIDYRKLIEHAADNSDYFDFILKSSAKNVTETDDCLSRKPISWLYAKFMLMLAKECGVETEKGIEINSPYTHHKLMEIFDLPKDTLKPEIQEFIKKGIIQMGRKNTVVTDIEALKQMVS